MTNEYRLCGFENRREYLEAVAETYGAELDAVLTIANLFGPDEDFDGLLSEVADMTGNRFMEVSKI